MSYPLRFPRYAALSAREDAQVAELLHGRSDWAEVAASITPEGYTGNPFKLVRALSADVDDCRDEWKREIAARERGIGEHGNADKHRQALRRLRELPAETEDAANALWCAANPAAPNGPPDPWEPLRCKTPGCIEELRDKAESNRTGGRCPECWAVARGAVRAERRFGKASELGGLARSVLDLIGK